MFNPYTLKIQESLEHTWHLGIGFWKYLAGNVSGYRCVPDCRSRGREFDPGMVPYFRGD